MRDKLIELLDMIQLHGFDPPADAERYDPIYPTNEEIADHLINNGVILTPCIAMVEQFIKDGKFDKKITAHNGKYAVVYVDKSKWKSPLIDITEQSYNAEKALERIQGLNCGADMRKEGEKDG